VTSYLPSSGNNATANATATATASGSNTTNITSAQCQTVDTLLCDTVTACSNRCAGSFCTDAFKKLLVCEAEYYAPNCTNLTAKACAVPAKTSGATTKNDVGLLVGMGMAAIVGLTMLL
jgi:hypothetical protein